MRAILILLTACLGAGLSHAQIQRQWARHHGGPAGLDDYGYNIAVDAQGDVYATGSSTGSSGVVEMLTVKLDACGAEQSARTYAGPGGGPDRAWAIEVDGAGNAIVVGDSLGAGTDYDLVVLKYAPDGTIVWVQRYDGPGSGFDGTDQGVCLALDASGNVFTGGYSVGLGTGYDSVVLKYAPDGTLLWEARTDGLAHATDNCTWIRTDDSGNAYVAGRMTNPGTGADIFVQKYDPSCSLLWEQRYDGPANGFDLAAGLALGPGNEAVVTGFSYGSGTDADAVTIQYDSDGNLDWVQRVDTVGGFDYGLTVAVSDQGMVAVTGGTFTGLDWAALILAYDSVGNLLWSHTYDVASFYLGNDFGLDVGIDAVGNVYSAGFGWDGYELGQQTYLVEYAPDGSLLFQDEFDGPAHGDDAVARLRMQGSEVYLAGLTQRGADHLDLLVLKYGPKSRQLPGTRCPEDVGNSSRTFDTSTRRPPLSRLGILAPKAGR